MRAALIDEKTGRIINLISADPSKDRAPAGCVLAEIPDGLTVSKRWTFNLDLKEFQPDAATIARRKRNAEIMADPERLAEIGAERQRRREARERAARNG